MIDVGVDVGGTFTDFTFFDRESGDHWVKKVSSTPSDVAAAVLAGLEDVELSRVGNIIHGTTVALNSVIQRAGAKTAIVTTKGFRDHIEIGDTLRYTGGIYDHRWVRTPPYPVPHEQRFTIDERTSGDGEVTVAVNDSEVEQLAETLAELEFEAVAVCFLNSYMNPENERRAADVLAKHLPNVAISISSVNPEFREYPRFITTVFNAFIAPMIAEYVNRLEAALGERGYANKVLYMTSAGGIASRDAILEEPMRLLFGAVAGGVSAGAYIARLGNIPSVVTFDMGGTSSDVGFVEDYRPQITATKVLVAFPIALPHLDVRSIGAGGGSIAMSTPDGTIRVGPESAGADPGPACYGRGGNDFTVTDANLLLGRIGETGLLGGEVALDRTLSEDAAQRLAAEVGMSDIYEMAAGVIDICNTNMYGAIREVSIERGSHPADLALVAFGGAGGLHAIAVADRLDMARVVVPRNAGIFSALGLLAADPRRDMVQPYLRPLSAVDFEDVGSQLLVMGNKARDILKAEGLNETDIDIEYRFGMRYAGQVYEEEVVAKSPATDYDQLAADFGNLYEGKYGFRREPEFAELINLRVVAIGRTAKPDLARALEQQSPAKPDYTTTRQVYFDGEFRECPVLQRLTLKAGDEIEGPAIVEEYDSTVVIAPDWNARIDNVGSLIMERQVGD
ncbi:MAG: hypothetical protein CL461_01745 [Acidimicrobiaceae bacterium]|nr:hypothetical protein [Acidimicrobiaceae bacterium]|tara:strand:- start:13983 stop:16016 length:2034 start_codon:yes stop_codon:yes gene_type:complete